MTPGRTLSLGCAVLLALGWAQGVRAQVQPSQRGDVIQEVVLEGEVDVDHQLIAANLRTRAGRPYIEAWVDEDTRWLANTYGILADVSVRPGPVVVFSLSRIRRFQQVHIVGNDAIKTSELMNQGQLRVGAETVPDDVAQARDRIRDYYLEKGYAFVQVDLQIDQSQQVATLWIFEGPKVEVADVVIEGLTALPVKDARSLLSSTPKLLNLIIAKPFRQDQVDRDVVALESFVRGEGYLDARVALSQLVWSGDRSEVTIHLYVDEGERYTVRSVRVVGNTAFGEPELLKVTELESGDYYRRPEIVRDVRRMRALYGTRGYVDADIRPQELYDETWPTLDLVWAVDEGAQKRVRDVLIRGNVGTRDQVVRRAITVYPGEIVNTQELNYSEDLLVSEGYFTDLAGTPQVRVTTEPTDDPELVDVVVDVGDSESGLFAFQVGAGSDSGIFGGVSIDKRNFDIKRSASSWGNFLEEFFGTGEAFHGGGQRLFMEVVPGTETTDLEVRFEDPWLNPASENPWGLTLNGYSRRRIFDEYDRERRGLYVGFSKNLSRRQSVALGVRGENTDISDVDTSPTTKVPTIAAAEGTASKTSLEGRWTYTDLDSRVEPTDGFVASVRTEFARGADIDVTRLISTGEWYFPMTETEEGTITVFHPRVAFGVLDGDGDLSPVTVNGVPVPGSPDSNDLPFYENFFVGGTTGPFAMRGFDFQGLGPHEGGEAIGGEVAMVVSLEGQVPLLTRYNPFRGKEETTVKGVAFLEFGNNQESNAIGDLTDDIRSSAGIGARMRLPALGGVTFAIDWAPFVSEQDEDETRAISFELRRRF